MGRANEMSGAELVRRAIEFRNPSRVPYNFDENRDGGEKYGDDFLWLFIENAADFRPERKGQTELGTVYETLDASFGQAKVHPLENLDALEGYRLPDYTRPERYVTMERRMREAPDRYRLGMFSHFLFQVMMDLVGFEPLIYAFIDRPADIGRLIEMLTESCLTQVEETARRGVHGLIAIEDLGVQDRLIVGPEIWRERFKPAYRRVIERMHEHGMHFFIHSCGNIFDLIEDFIEIGVDVVQIDQQDNMGIGRLAERYAGRICFFCPADIQTRLSVPGNYAAIEASVRELVTRFSKNGGGFMAKTYPQNRAIGIPEENTRFMCEAFKRWGEYSAHPAG